MVKKIEEAGSHHFERRTTKNVPRAKVDIVPVTKPGKIVELSPKEFMIDLKVQREVNELRVIEMAKNFQPQSLGLLTASKREDGHIYCLDGAHRIAAARKARWNGLLATRLFTGLTLAEEAGLFLTTNNTRSVQAIDKFKVRITMGDPSAVNINTILKNFDLHVDWANNESKNIISAIATVEKIYYGAGVLPYRDHPDLVYKVFRTLTDAYGLDSGRTTWGKAMIEGMGIFWASFGSRINRERLVEALQGNPPRAIVAQAQMLRDAKGGTIGENAAEVIHKHYNHRNRAGKLPAIGDVDPRDAWGVEMDPQYVSPALFEGVGM